MRLSIELSPEQHQLLKAAAAMQGKSIKDYVLGRTLPGNDEQEALRQLETFLKPRIEAATAGFLSTKSVDDIFNEVRGEDREI
ncbi:MAG: hypothetical protein RL497_844 [Pseudomonadota bacterium]|jgi:hypothetical protein